MVKKSMLPLRRFAIASNVFFIAYGFLMSIWPAFFLHIILLPLNTNRLLEIRRLTAEIKKATETSPVSKWLLPHMTRRAAESANLPLDSLPSGKEFEYYLQPSQLTRTPEEAGSNNPVWRCNA